MYVLGSKSLSILDTVHPDLRYIVKLAIQYTDTDFSVVEGIRTPERQQELVDQGMSQTLDSYHLTGHAVDIYPWVDGATSHDDVHYRRIAKAMFRAAIETGTPLEWGGFWRTFIDKPHWQIKRG